MPVCRFCGDRFLGRSDACYCSDACRQAAYRKRKRNAVTDGAARPVVSVVSGDVLSVTNGMLPSQSECIVLGDPVRVVVCFEHARGWREVG
jgi:hypothetical protein